MLATTIHKSNTTPHHQSRATTTNPKTYSGRSPHHRRGPQPTSGIPGSGRRDSGPVVSKPNSVSGSSLTGIDHSIPYRLTVCRAPEPGPLQTTGPSLESVETQQIRAMRAGSTLVVLLRKEVIQPHLPVRLPCYDFVPIADPTFDGSLPQGIRRPASVGTNLHDVTGGVYNAGERIHL